MDRARHVCPQEDEEACLKSKCLKIESRAMRDGGEGGSGWLTSQ